MKNITIPDTITVILNYNDKNVSINVKRFKKLSYIKEKIYHLFYPIKSDIKIKYNNKDLSCFLEQSIGLIFENRTRIRLLVEQIYGSKKQLIKKVKLNSQKNLFSGKSEQSIISSPITNNRYKSIKVDSLKKNNLNYNSISPISIKKKLPPIKNKNLLSYKLLNNNEDKKNKTKTRIWFSSYKTCRECFEKDTKYYCRKCGEFICNRCFIKKHKKHLKLEININDNEYTIVDNYKNEIANKFNIAIDNLNNIENVIKNEINVDEWQQKYNEAVNNLTKIAEEKNEEIKNNENNDKHKNTNKNKRNEFQKKIEEEIEALNNITISVTKDPFALFIDINKRERIIDKTIKRGKSEINNIEEMFFDIENEIDNVLFDLEEQISHK